MKYILFFISTLYNFIKSRNTKKDGEAYFSSLLISAFYTHVYLLFLLPTYHSTLNVIFKRFQIPDAYIFLLYFSIIILFFYVIAKKNMLDNFKYSIKERLFFNILTIIILMIPFIFILIMFVATTSSGATTPIPKI
jgi:hypothetical protein